MANQSNLFGNLLGDLTGTSAKGMVEGEKREQENDARNEMTAREAQQLAAQGRHVRVTAVGGGDYRIQTHDGANEVVTLTDDAARALQGQMRFTESKTLEASIAQRDNPALDRVVERAGIAKDDHSQHALKQFTAAMQHVFKDKDSVTLESNFSHNDVFIPAGTYDKQQLIAEIGHDLELKKKTMARLNGAVDGPTAEAPAAPAPSAAAKPVDFTSKNFLDGKLTFTQDVTQPLPPQPEATNRGSALDAALQEAAARHAAAPAPQPVTKTGAQTIEPAENQLEFIVAAQKAGGPAADARAMDELVASKEKLTILANQTYGRFDVTVEGKTYDIAIDKNGQEMLKYADAKQVAFNAAPPPPNPEKAAEPELTVPPALASAIQAHGGVKAEAGVSFAAKVDQATAIKMGQEITHAEAGSDLAKMVEKTLLGQKEGDGKLNDQEMMSAVQRLQMTGKLTELAEAMKGLKDAGVQTAAPADQPKGPEMAQYNSTLPKFTVEVVERG